MSTSTTGKANRSRPIELPKRAHVLQSAGYWFDGARKAQTKGDLGEALLFMENGYNHLENALSAAEDILSWITRCYDVRNASSGMWERDLDMLARVNRYFKLAGKGVE